MVTCHVALYKKEKMAVIVGNKVFHNSVGTDLCNDSHFVPLILAFTYIYPGMPLKSSKERNSWLKWKYNLYCYALVDAIKNFEKGTFTTMMNRTGL